MACVFSLATKSKFSTWGGAEAADTGVVSAVESANAIPIRFPISLVIRACGQSHG